MKKLKIVFMVLISFLMLSSCSSKNSEIEQLYGKRYGAVGSGISVMKKGKSYSVLLLKIMQKKMCLVDISIILKL